MEGLWTQLLLVIYKQIMEQYGYSSLNHTYKLQIVATEGYHYY